jgi:restriction system protein
MRSGIRQQWEKKTVLRTGKTVGRKRQAANVTSVLITQPWWVAAGFGVAIFVVMRWLVPSALPPLLKGVGIGLQAIAWVPLAWFFFVGGLSFIRSREEPRLSFPAPSRPVPSLRKKVELTSVVPAQKLGHEWGNSFTGRTNVPADNGAQREWTIDALRELEWKRFELLCAKYYELSGFRSETIRCGADGGIDVKLYRLDPNKPIAIVQCKAWNGTQVGVAPVRELLGVMTSEKVGRGIFLTTSTFTKDALAFAETNPIQLLDGPGFLKKIRDLPDSAKHELIKFAFAGDYATPTCASCGVKMVRRESRRGPLWGCINYPRCRCYFPIRR